MNFKQELQTLLKSRYLFINVITYEEEIVEYVIKKIHLGNIIVSIYYWDFIDGYQGNPKLDDLAKQNPMQALELIENYEFSLSKKHIFILRDFYSFLQDRSIIRKMRNLSRKLKNTNCHIIIISFEIYIPDLLKDVITIIEFPLPTLKEIYIELSRLISINSWNIHNCDIEDLAFACKGLSIERIRRLVCRIITLNLSNYDIFRLVFQEKQQFIKQIDSLNYCYYSQALGLDDIGGLNLLKSCLKKRSVSFSKQAFNYGIPAPKGVLLTGIQGTGKSLVAKSLSYEWKLPFLKLDVGRLFAGVVGKSEEKIRNMIQVAEASAPCILWIDEIDKAFSGVMNSYGDSGTSKGFF